MKNGVRLPYSRKVPIHGLPLSSSRRIMGAWRLLGVDGSTRNGKTLLVRMEESIPGRLAM